MYRVTVLVLQRPPQSVFCTVITLLACRVLWIQLWTWLWEAAVKWFFTSSRTTEPLVLETFLCVSFLHSGLSDSQYLKECSTLQGQQLWLSSYSLVASSRLSNSGMTRNRWRETRDTPHLCFTCGFSCPIFVFFRGVFVSVCVFVEAHDYVRACGASPDNCVGVRLFGYWLISL